MQNTSACQDILQTFTEIARPKESVLLQQPATQEGVKKRGWRGSPRPVAKPLAGRF